CHKTRWPVMDSNAPSKEFARPDSFRIVDLKMPTVAEPSRVMCRSRWLTIGVATAPSLVFANVLGRRLFTALGLQLPTLQSACPASARRCFYHLSLFGW